MLRDKRIKTLEYTLLQATKDIELLYGVVNDLMRSKEPNTDRRHQAHSLKWRTEQSRQMKAYWAAKKGA